MSSLSSSPSSTSGFSVYTNHGVKRAAPDESSNSLGSLSVQSALRPPKKWRTNKQGGAAAAMTPSTSRVSFGSLHEAIIFDRTGSSNELNKFRRVQVSELSFGSSAMAMEPIRNSGTFRWGEQKNATWSTNVLPPAPGPNARWSNHHCGRNSSMMMHPPNNLLLQSAAAAGMVTPTPTTTTSTSASTTGVRKAPSPLAGLDQTLRFPTRCPSPPPPTPSPPIGTAITSPDNHLMHVSLSSFASTLDLSDKPLQPVARCESPMSTRPGPDKAKPSPTPLPEAFGAPPKRPVRCQSPVFTDSA